MLECFVKLGRRCLQLHAGRQSIRRPSAPADEPVDLFLNVDEGLFHGVTSVIRPDPQSKLQSGDSGEWHETLARDF